jgi:hypothetical protein
MNFLDLIFFFLIGYLVWSILTGYVLKQKMTAYIAGATAAASLIDSDRPLEEKVMIVKTEIIKINQDKELVLLYDRNDCFLGQGSTEAEAIDSIRRAFPTETLVLVDSFSKLSNPVL